MTPEEQAAVEEFGRLLVRDVYDQSIDVLHTMISRGLQGNFELPIVPMTEREKAIILNNLGLIALRQDKKNIAKGLFAAAVEAHPQHYEAASDRLAALDFELLVTLNLDFLVGFDFDFLIPFGDRDQLIALVDFDHVVLFFDL